MKNVGTDPLAGRVVTRRIESTEEEEAAGIVGNRHVGGESRHDRERGLNTYPEPPSNLHERSLAIDVHGNDRWL